jgi:hypothetical protein
MIVLHSTEVVHIPHKKLFRLLFPGDKHLHFAMQAKNIHTSFGVRQRDHFKAFQWFSLADAFTNTITG